MKNKFVNESHKAISWHICNKIYNNILLNVCSETYIRLDFVIVLDRHGHVLQARDQQVT